MAEERKQAEGAGSLTTSPQIAAAAEPGIEAAMRVVEITKRRYFAAVARGVGTTFARSRTGSSTG